MSKQVIKRNNTDAGEATLRTDLESQQKPTAIANMGAKLSNRESSEESTRGI